MTKKNKRENKRLTKEVLFKDFFHITYKSLETFESWFDANGITAKFYGSEPSDNFEKIEAREALTNRVQQSSAWSALSALYDYAVDGYTGNQDPTDIVIDGAEVLSLITTENYKPTLQWEMIVARGDGRFALDEGEDVYLDKLALLAEVDIRTVRNAVSAGELRAYKKKDLFQPGIHIENASARAWLQGRRDFKPTICSSQTTPAIEDVGSPTDFATFLVARREQLGLSTDEGKLVPFAPGLDSKGLATVEAGIFTLPLNAVNPLADFYQVDRKAFLDCVMRVFFSEYYTMIRESRNV